MEPCLANLGGEFVRAMEERGGEVPRGAGHAAVLSLLQVVATQELPTGPRPAWSWEKLR